MASISLTWHVLRDGHKICPICQELDGHTWDFEAGEGKPSELSHSAFGNVWTSSEQSTVHQRFHMRGPCHCYFTFSCDLKDWLEKLDKIIERLEAAASSSKNTVQGNEPE